MPSISPSSNISRYGFPDPDLINSLSQKLERANFQQVVIFKILKTYPQRVTDEMLAESRASLKEALEEIEPYINRKRPVFNTARLAKSYLNLSAVYEECIKRDNEKPGHTILPLDDRDTLYEQAKKMFESLEQKKEQIHYLERAIELFGSKAHNAELKNHFEYTLVGYQIEITQQFYTMINVLLSPANPDQWDQCDLDGHPGTSGITGTLDEVLKYLNPLKKRIQYIANEMMAEVNELDNKPETHFQFKNLIQHFSQWNQEISEHAFGLANVLFYAMECQPKPEGEDLKTITKHHYAEILDSVFLLVDMTDKMRAQGYVTQKQRQPRAQRNMGGIDDAGIQAKPAKLEMDSRIDDSEDSSSPKSTAPFENSNTSSGINDKKARSLMRLLDKEPSQYFTRLCKDREIFPPDTILKAADTATEPTTKLIKLLERELADPTVVQSTFANLIQEKLGKLRNELLLLKDPALRFDLYKKYKFPQAKHWLTLFNHQQIAKVHPANRLPSDESEHLYEIELVPKANSDGTQASSVYLHLHLTNHHGHDNKQSLIRAIVQNPQLIKAAHLKSSYFRDKGKNWEGNKAQNQYEKLVRRSPVNKELLEAIAKFYSQPQGRASLFH